MCARGSEWLSRTPISTLEPGFILRKFGVPSSCTSAPLNPRAFIFWDSLTHPIETFLSSCRHCYRIGSGVAKIDSGIVISINENHTNEELHGDNRKERAISREYECNIYYRCVNICNIIVSIWRETMKRVSKCQMIWIIRIKYIGYNSFFSIVILYTSKIDYTLNYIFYLFYIIFTIYDNRTNNFI